MVSTILQLWENFRRKFRIRFGFGSCIINTNVIFMLFVCKVKT